MHLEELTELFVGEVCAGKTNETAKTYRGKLRYLLRFVGADAPACCLNSERLTQFKLALQQQRTSRRGSRLEQKPLSPFTIRTVLVTVRHFCKWATRAHHLCCDPSLDLVLPPAPPPEPKAITAQMVKALLQTAASTGERRERERDVALICLLRDTGGRVSGLAGAQLDDLELRRGRLWVIEKGARRHALHLSPTTCAALRAYLCSRMDFKPTTEALFVSKRGTAMARGTIYNLLRRLAQRSGLPGRFNPHSFRHAFARDAIDAGADLAQVSQLLGHTSVAVTAMYYARWDDRELHAIHQRTSPGRLLPRVKIEDE